MRTISEQELKDILDKHSKWFNGVEGGVQADLSNADLRYADLRYANLRYADLRYADLSNADLRYADLRYANLSNANLRYANLIIFQFQQHMAFYTFDGSLRIGCIVMPVNEWDLGFEEIGKANGYTAEQIKMYGGFISICLTHFKEMK